MESNLRTDNIYKNLNGKNQVNSKEKSAPGKKKSKERVTIIQCVNSTWDHMLPL